jgi:hypothetical protein
MNIRTEVPSGVPADLQSSVAPVSAPVRRVLHYGAAKHPLAEVVPDANWPGMWRVRWPDGSLSDLGNLTRVKEAAFLVAQRGRNHTLLRWRKV